MSQEDVAIVDGPGYNGDGDEEPGPVAFVQDVPVNPGVFAAMEKFAGTLAELQLHLREHCEHEGTAYRAAHLNRLEHLTRALRRAESRLMTLLVFSHHGAEGSFVREHGPVQ